MVVLMVDYLVVLMVDCLADLMVVMKVVRKADQKADL
jgi:hypothetical protein